ncbi:IclR family transcriptional regulator domain-containing protein [Roseicitreum antarcticum]|uniref:Transcriptional regulator, IclR family n=1 Tax=Roseicitreum antarcticum TaxID=564137 RepID=A0A1H2YYG6_9RHOB|nr:IclR family transcriptional regulator C-terminal domain-containing protein [Roseicitreum antarcticum]SDX10111.1 transcriptional regulator, IclR family [Roseicitreum antarcticum]
MSDDSEKLKVRTERNPARTGLMTASADSPDEDGGLNPRDYVSSLVRGLDVLRAFNRTRRKMSLTEVAAETGNTRAGARRILLTLVHEGYAVADGKLFDLTPQVLELGFSVLSSKGAWDIARPFIDHLSDEIRESVSAAVLDKFDVVYVSGAQYHRVISVGITVGARFPAHCTATGRVLLAAQPEEMWPGILQNIPLTPMTPHTVTDRHKLRAILEETREKGWNLVDEELEIGLASIAVPLRSSQGVLVGAINVGVPTVRMSVDEIVETVLPRLLETAANISQALKR